MATHPRDGAQEVPVEGAKDPRVPLRRLCFNAPTAIPGITSSMITQLTMGERRIMDGKDWLPPPMWLDRALRVVKIGPWSYPLERVHYYEQAVTPATKPTPPLNLDKFTVGKR